MKKEAATERSSLDPSITGTSTVNKRSGASLASLPSRSSLASTSNAASFTESDISYSIPATSSSTCPDNDTVTFGGGSPVVTHAPTPAYPIDPIIALLDGIETLEQQLPTKVPVANSQDLISCFSADPVETSEFYEDPHEMVNKILHQVFGWGASVDEIAGKVRRGELGVIGLVRWTRKCIETLGVGSGLFEPRLALMHQAMEKLWVAFVLCPIYSNSL